MSALRPLRGQCILSRLSACFPRRGFAEGKFGKMLPESMPRSVGRGQAMPLRPTKNLGTPGMPASTPGHLMALQRLAELMPGTNTGDSLRAWWKNRQVRNRERRDRTQQERVFKEAQDFLMEPEVWTYGSFLAYQRKLLDLIGGYSWRRRLGDDPSMVYLEKGIRILEAMSPVELASNHKKVFTPEAIKLIAEKSNVSTKQVDQVILEHDIMRADRRWYQILRQFKRPEPKTFEDRSFMAEYDRPFSQAEMDQREEYMEKMQRQTEGKARPRLSWIWYRHPSVGGNRWSTRPPKWYPAKWKVRPERKLRLAGVGVPGGGGDRGKRWGRLASYAGAGR